MGRKLNLSHLSEAECEHILNVVHKDFNIRSMEKERLRQIEEDVQEEETKYSILSKSRIFNEKNCICCFSRFLLLFNPRILCDSCKFQVCKNCVQVDQETKNRFCSACLKHRQLKKQSNEWFYSSVEKKFKRCGSAKVIRSLYKRRLVDDGSRSLVVMMTHSDSDSAAMTHPWHSIDDDAGDNARQQRRYGATLPKSFTMATDDAVTECGIDGRGFPRSTSPGGKGQGHLGDDEKGLCSSHRVSSRGKGERRRVDGRWMEEDSSVEEEEEAGGIASANEMLSSRSALESNRDGTCLGRVDSCIQTERAKDLAETGTMTVWEEASKCFDGFDGMSTVSTEGHETDPQFIVRPYNIRVLEGEPLVVECKVNGTEPLDVLWFCNRNQVQQLEEDDRSEVRRHGDTFLLTLFEMRPSDSLEYLCIAVNAIGQCAQGFTVTVDANTHAQKSPEFMSPSDSVEIVPEGGQAVLRCSFSAYPEPKVTWYKNSKKLTHGGRYQTKRHVPSALQYSLVIDEVKSEDSGTYCAVASNVAGQSRLSVQLLVQPSVSEKRTGRDDAVSPAFLHSNEDDLMRLAEGVSRTQGRYTTTATRMLRSADVMSSMQSQLDEMDRALQGLEGEVLDVISDEDDDEDSANNNNFRPLLDDLDDMKSSAEAVGMVTSAALQLLSSAKELAMETLERDGENECQEEEAGEEGESNEGEEKEEEEEEEEEEEKEEECVDAGDLKLSYQELEELYKVGLISRSQLRNRLVQKRNVKQIRSFLQSTMSCALKDSSDHAHSAAGDQSESSSAMDTSIESLESRGEILSKKRNKNRNEKENGDVDRRSTTSLVAADAADAELVENQLLKRTEQQIYLTSGKVFSLEDCIRDLEREVLKVDEETPAETLASLENSVAKAVAQVTQSDREVNDVERQVAQWMENSNKNMSRCSRKLNQKQQLQQLKSVVRNQPTSDSETENKTLAYGGEIIG